ncbi:uncharacterized protein C21orf58 homolog isoform X3 [Coturnix japonica]|uniref:uncharacterized protein C21orf58 homolog isoform X3 n=1 Tax=Coturnix japonica TaxID=93934 RepID=UPI0013A5E233|nr:uncharacterized protein C21orf58 homolog isoform X3 [Coturnix japonica]
MKCFPRLPAVCSSLLFTPTCTENTLKICRKKLFSLVLTLTSLRSTHLWSACYTAVSAGVLQEQHLLEELSQPSAPARAQYRNYSAGPPHIYQIPFPAPQAETPRIIQQAMPPQPATIIQQLPQPPPLIAQIPTVQPFAHPRSGSIKEDMVEMMLMQNAQMHQIIMQNMMLKSLPPVAFAQPARPGCPPLQHTQQDLQISAPVAVKADRPWQSTVHHHHHYSPPGLPLHAVPAGLLMPGEGLPSASSSQRWTSSVLPAMQMWPTY